MGRRRGRSRKLGASSKPSAMATRTRGTSSRARLSMRRTLFASLALDSLPSSAYSVTSLLYYPGPENHPMFHAPVSPSTEIGLTEEPSLPLILEDGTIYKANEILDSRCCGGQLEYLVDWEGNGSWVPRNYILDPTLLEEFHSTHPGRPTPRGRCRPP